MSEYRMTGEALAVNKARMLANAMGLGYSADLPIRDRPGSITLVSHSGGYQLARMHPNGGNEMIGGAFTSAVAFARAADLAAAALKIAP